MGRGKSKSQRAQSMPMCSYGIACTRKDCVYKHPPRPKKATASAKKAPQGGGLTVVAPRPPPAAGNRSDKRVCVAYLAGICTFGSYCDNLHPEDPDEIAALLAGY